MKKEQDKEMDTTEQFASLVSDCSQTPGSLSPGNSLLSTALGVDNDDAGQAMPGLSILPSQELLVLSKMFKAHAIVNTFKYSIQLLFMNYNSTGNTARVA
jgi:hypothetical protein